MKQNSMKKISIQTITLAILGVFAITSISLTVYQMNRKQKFAIVDLAKLYSDFELKKQLEGQMTNVQDIRRKNIDSLELTLNILSHTIQNLDPEKNKPEYETKVNEFDVRKQEYLYKKDMMDQDNEAMSQQYNDQIWKQLNQYVEDYGKANGIECIIGGDGSGNVMYRESSMDLTDEMVSYCNDRYKGEGKN